MTEQANALPIKRKLCQVGLLALSLTLLAACGSNDDNAEVGDDTGTTIESFVLPFRKM